MKRDKEDKERISDKIRDRDKWDRERSSDMIIDVMIGIVVGGYSLYVSICDGAVTLPLTAKPSMALMVFCKPRLCI